VEIRTGTAVDAETLKVANFDEVIVSTGIAPRLIDIPGGNDPRVVGYTKILDGTVQAGDRVVIIGGGGIGHDVALFLAMESNGRRPTREEFFERWGINGKPRPHAARRQITMVKRSPGAFGRTLGKSTGWILRQELKDFGVRQIADVNYVRIDAQGLHIAMADRSEILPFDTLVVCAGQEPERRIADDIAANHISQSSRCGASPGPCRPESPRWEHPSASPSQPAPSDETGRRHRRRHPRNAGNWPRCRARARHPLRS
jgi:2,4-dienoyl-CoA reductase (NADPH2)